jgi:dienelactone hydrolase
MNMQPVNYSDGDVHLTGFLACDAKKTERRPGILVVHGGRGLDDHAKGRARQLAELGCVAFACDMYGDDVSGDRERKMTRIKELSGDPTRLCRRAKAGLEVLASHPQVDGRMAAVGYCFGGMTVLELARNGTDLAGVMSIHGSLKTTRPAQASAVKAKVLVCHGALDPHVPQSHLTAFIDEMNNAGVDWQLIVYGGAMHGFTHEDAAEYKVPGVAYNAAADARSSEAVKKFLEELFGSQT